MSMNDEKKHLIRSLTEIVQQIVLLLHVDCSTAAIFWTLDKKKENERNEDTSLGNVRYWSSRKTGYILCQRKVFLLCNCVMTVK